MRFGRLEVKQFVGMKNGHPQWKCRCDCGNETIVTSGHLGESTISCGCKRREAARLMGAASKKHGRSETPEWFTWQSLIQRCTNPRARDYPRYGGQGVRVCSRWLGSFESFFADMGLRPSSTHTIDRTDNLRGYEPKNCRWATKREQANNRRTNIVIEYAGQKKTLIMWAEELGISRDAIYSRHRRGWPIEKLLSPRKFRRTDRT